MGECSFNSTVINRLLERVSLPLSLSVIPVIITSGFFAEGLILSG